MNIILFDDHRRVDLLPLAFTRPCAELRVGILTISEKWAKHLPGKTSHLTQDYLSEKYALNHENENLYINGRALPDDDLISQINSLSNNETLINDEIIIAFKTKIFSR